MVGIMVMAVEVTALDMSVVVMLSAQLLFPNQSKSYSSVWRPLARRQSGNTASRPFIRWFLEKEVLDYNNLVCG